MSHRHWNISWVQASFISLCVILVQPCAKKKKSSSSIALDALPLVKGHSGFRHKGLCDVQKISKLRQRQASSPLGRKAAGLLLLALLGSRSPVIHGRLLRAEQVRSQWVVSKILNKNRFHWLFWFPKLIFLWIIFSEGSCLVSRRKGNLLTHMAKASLFLITVMWSYPVIFWKAKNCSSEKALSSKNCDLKDKCLLTGIT